jgi:hypothetical protein
MIRKFITASLAVALAGLFYFTDRLEQSRASVTVSPDLPRLVQPGDPGLSLNHREPASVR